MLILLFARGLLLNVVTAENNKQKNPGRRNRINFRGCYYALYEVTLVVVGQRHQNLLFARGLLLNLIAGRKSRGEKTPADERVMYTCSPIF
jgi:hypothetical protein